MKQKVFLGILLIILVLFGYEMYDSYMDNHAYYFDMLATAKSRKILIAAIVSGAIPVLYLLFTTKPKLLQTVVMLFLGLLVFSFFHVSQKGGLVGAGGVFMFLLNTTFLFVLGGYFLVGIQAVGSWIGQKVLRFSTHRIQEMLLSFGLGLGAFLLCMQLLILTQILYRPIIWAMCIGFGVMIYVQKNNLQGFQKLLEENILPVFSYKEAHKKRYVWILVILLCVTILYYMFGFQLSFIPYSTAWDANHAYMYIPKVFAENHGTWVGSPGGTSPVLRYAYITFWFALIEPIKDWFWIGPSTVGVAMNFLSGILVLFFGLALTNEVIETITKPKEIEDAEKNHALPYKPLLISIGWCVLLLRLTSGMGAFLVFIDNKTDLGVMGLTLLALLSGLIFFNKIQQAPTHQTTLDRSTRSYIAVSGVFFALSAMAKPTAFQDALLFGLLLVGVRVGFLLIIGGTIFMLGFLAKNEVLTMKLYLTPEKSRPYMIIGAILSAISPIKTVLQRQVHYIKYIAFWAGSFLLTLFICKGPQVLYTHIVNETLTPTGFFKMLLLGQNTQPAYIQKQSPLLLAGSHSQHRLIAQAIQTEQLTVTSVQSTDQPVATTSGAIASGTVVSGAVVVQTPPIDLVAQCKEQTKNIDTKTLFSGLQTSVGGGMNEDLERYIGFGQRNFPKPNFSTIQMQKLQQAIQMQQARATANGGNADIATITQELQNSSRHMFAINLSARWEQMFDWIGYAPLRVLFRGNGCFGRNADAKVLCENTKAIESFDIPALQKIQSEMDPISDGYRLLSGILHEPSVQQAQAPINVMQFQDEIIALRSFHQDRTIFINEQGDISVPYRYFVPLNISVINKLQNPSSYYTDIGYIFFMLFLILIVGTIYTATYFYIVRTKKGTIEVGHTYPFSFAVHLTAIAGWVIWRGIGSAILWYGIGLIARTMLANIVFLGLLYRHTAHNTLQRKLYYALLIVLAFWGTIQLFLNFIRISSQGGESVFVRYKGNTAKTYTYKLENGAFTNKEKTQYNYKRKDVFDMQFGHYNRFIEYVQHRKDEDGVFIAGTYIQYFLHNQKHIFSDGLLTQFREMMSDYNTCKTYKRLQEKKIKYMIIDGNIPSVVMGDGNKTLTDRVFAKIDPVTQTIEKHGALSMLAQMVHDGYVKMLYSNALNAKYAYMLSDQDILFFLQGAPQGDIVATTLLPVAQKDMNLFRSKMAIARFFPQDAQFFFELTARIFQARLQNGQAIEDIADVMGKQVDTQKLISYLMRLESGYTPDLEKEINEKLIQDEFFILQQYTAAIQAAKSGNQQGLQQFVQQILSQSIGSSSQVLAFELVE